MGNSPRAVGFSLLQHYTAHPTGGGLWNKAQGNHHLMLLVMKLTHLTGGDYSAGNSMRRWNADLGDLVTGYDLFSRNPENMIVDYLIMGPSGGTRTLNHKQKQTLMSIADEQKRLHGSTLDHIEQIWLTCKHQHSN